MQDLKPKLTIDDSKAFDPSIYVQTHKTKVQEKEAEARFKNWQPILYSMPEFQQLSDKGKQNAIETLKNNPEKFFEVIKQTPYYSQLSDKGKEKLKESLFNPVKYRQEKVNAPTVAEKHGQKYEGDSANPDVYIDPTGWAGVGAFMGVKAIPGVVSGDLIGEATKYIANKGKDPYSQDHQENFLKDYVLPLAADITSGYIGAKIYDKLPKDASRLFTKLIQKGKIDKAKQLIKKNAPDVKDTEIDEFVNKAQEILNHPEEEVKLQPKKEVIPEQKINHATGLDKQKELAETGADVLDEANQQVRQNVNLNSSFSKLSEEDINTINREIESFNKQLIEVAQNKLPPNTLLKLGKPKSILKSIGFPDLDFTINPKILARKIKKHGINIEDIKTLPLDINNPSIVYKLPKEKNIVIATTKKKDNGILVTAVKLNAEKTNIKEGFKVNDIRTIYYKDIDKFIKHLEELEKNGNVFYINKEKAIGMLSDPQAPIAQGHQHPNSLINNLYEKSKNSSSNLKNFYAGIPTSEVFKSLSKIDNLIYKNITSKIENTKVDKFLRKYLLADKYGFGSISRKKEDIVINNYIKLKAHLARGDISAEKKEKILNKYLDRLEEGKRKVIEKLMIQYLENPTIRDRVKKELPEVAQDLDQIRKEIDRLGKFKMERGLITPSQFLKWKDKYLTRLYVMDDDVEGLDITRGIKQYEEKKGRKIESIVDFIEYLKQTDPIKAQEWEKKAILDPIKAVKATLAKSYANLAIDDFYRKVINDPELVPQQYLVELPIDVGKLPKKMSPYYAETKVLPYLRDILQGVPELQKAKSELLDLKKQLKELVLKRKENPKDKELILRIKEIRAQIKEKEKALNKLKTDLRKSEKYKPIREAIKNLRKQIQEKKYLIERDSKILEGKGYRQLSEKSKARFSVISGLPVHKDIANLIEGMTRIIENPMDTASKLDKFATSATAYFKWAKVPGNIFSYPRNLASNWIQFSMSGADPVSFPIYYGKALKDVVSKDKYYQLAKKWGLFKSNLASEEVSKIFRELNEAVKYETNPRGLFIKFVKLLQKYKVLGFIEKVGEIYGWIDDVAKLARLRYAIEVEKKPIKEAVRVAQDTHFDYGLTYNVIRAMRDPNVDRGVFLKLFGTLFPTYTHKALSFLYDTIIKRPATLSALLAGFYAVKQYIEAQNEKRVGKEKYEKLKKLAPEFLDSPFVIPIVDKDGKWITFVDASYIVPFGSIVNFVQDLIQRQPGEAVREIGALSNPIYAVKGLHDNRDPLTGRMIYYPYDNWEKTKGSTEYILDQFILPLTIVKIKQLWESKHPSLPRILTGMLWYEYPESNLKEFKKSKIEKIKSDTNYWIAPYHKDLEYWAKAYNDGKISKEEFEEKRKEIIEKIKHYRQLERKAIIEELKKMR